MSRTSPTRIATLVLLVVLSLLVFLLLRGDPVVGPTGSGAGGISVSRDPLEPSLGEPEIAELSGVEAGTGDVEQRVLAEAGDRGRISGRVIDIESGQPVPGVRVRWTEIPPLIDLVDGMKRSLITRVKHIKQQYDRELFGSVDGRAPVITDALGRFSLLDVTSSKVYLYVSDGPYFQVDIESLKIRPGEHVAGVEVFVRVGGRVVGRVLDLSGAPVEGAELNLFYPLSALSIMTRESRGTRKVQTHSDATGAYELAAVAAGTGYFLYAIVPDHARVIRKGITVQRGADTRVDLLVSSGGIITGVVTDEDGAPISGAEVRPIRLGPVFDMLFEGDVGVFDGATDDAGRYRISGLPAGTYRVFVSAAGHAPTYRPGVEVRNGAVTRRVDFAMAPGSFLSGRIVDSRGRPLAGALVRAGGGRPMVPGDPASGFSAGGHGVEVPQVQLPTGTPDELTPKQREKLRSEFFKSLGMLRSGSSDDVDDEIRERPFDGQDYTYLVHRFQVDTGADGLFLISGLPRDEAFWIWIHHEHYSDRLIRGAVPGTDDLEIVLEDLGGFAGIVVAGDTGEPLRRFEVSARNLMGFDRVERRFDSDDGQFTVDGLNPGPYRYTVSAEAYERRFDGRVVVAAGANTAGQIVVLQPGARVSGFVVDGLDGSPIEGAEVVPRREEGPFYENLLPRVRSSAKSGVDGAFEMPGLGEGDRFLTASHPRHVTTVVTVPDLVKGEQRTGVVIRMPAGGAIEGLVLGPGGRPVSGLDVMVQSRDRTTFRQAVSGLDGKFRVEGLAAGPYVVMRLDLDLSDGDVFAMFPRVLNGLRPVSADVRDGETTSVTMRLDDDFGGVQVEGIVLERDVPVPGAFVTMIRIDGGTPGVGGLRSDRSDASGRYVIGGVNPGSYIARISGPPVQPGDVRVRVEVPDDEQVRIDLQVPGGAIVGRVKTVDTGVPQQGVAINLEASLESGTVGSMRVARGVTDEDGVFRLRRLSAGSFSLSIRGTRVDGVVYGGLRRDEIVLDADQLLDLGDLELCRGGTVRGKVVDADGEPVELAAIFFRGESGLAASVSDTLTGPDGTFERSGLAVGGYRVQTRALGYSSDAVDVELAEGGIADVLLTVGAGGSANIYVVDESGQRVSGARVEVRNAAGDLVSDLISPTDLVGGYLAGTGAPGVLIVTGLALEPHTIKASKKGVGAATRKVLIDADPTAVLIRLE